jgi:PAS domain S-box-containing protein
MPPLFRIILKRGGSPKVDRGAPGGEEPTRKGGRKPSYIDLAGETPRRLVDEAEVREIEARKAAMLESAIDAVVAIDHRGFITEFNPTAERVFGYSRAEVIGRSMADLMVPPSLRERHRRAFARYLATGESTILGRPIEITAMRADGTEFPVELAVARIDLPGPPTFTAYIRDIGHRKRRERALQESLDRRRQLEALLIHAQESERKRIAWDLHDDSIQVMTAVAIRLKGFRRRVAGNPELADQLDELEGVVGEAIRRLRGLLFELRPLVLDREGLAAALRQYLDTMEREGISGSLESRLRTEPSPETRALLYRLAQEALTNVVKHARANTVDILLDERGEGVALRVRDDGAGFSPERQSPRPGHLGLVAMRERAEIFGGSCRIESAPGLGTTIYVWVPAQPALPGS